jgi:hypothetical protein
MMNLIDFFLICLGQDLKGRSRRSLSQFGKQELVILFSPFLIFVGFVGVGFLFLVEPNQFQLLYFHIPPRFKNPWMAMVFTGLEFIPLCMITTAHFILEFQLLFFQSSTFTLRSISEGLR